MVLWSARALSAGSVVTDDTFQTFAIAGCR